MGRLPLPLLVTAELPCGQWDITTARSCLQQLACAEVVIEEGGECGGPHGETAVWWFRDECIPSFRNLTRLKYSLQGPPINSQFISTLAHLPLCSLELQYQQ